MLSKRCAQTLCWRRRCVNFASRGKTGAVEDAGREKFLYKEVMSEAGSRDEGSIFERMLFEGTRFGKILNINVVRELGWRGFVVSRGEGCFCGSIL